MRSVTLPSGEKIPAFGLGTWQMGQSAASRAAEVAVVRHALDRGIRLIDTAEMYGEGGAEEVVGEALKGRTEKVFVVSKVYPKNASAKGTLEACERSLKRLKRDQIDLYLLHWRGGFPLAETVGAFVELKAAGKIRHWGVSNFDVADMQELASVPGGASCASNQVLYHLGERGIEWALLPHEQAAGRPLMAYSPLGQGQLLTNPKLKLIADRLGVTPAGVALAFVLARQGVIAIPKTSSASHLDDNLKALDLTLDSETLKSLDRAFPPPKGPGPLAMG